MPKLIVMLVPALALALISCGGKEPVAAEDVQRQAFDDLREQVAEVIEDADREEAVLALVDDLHDEFTAMREAVETRRIELRKLNADFGATREQFRNYMQRYDAAIKAARRDVTRQRLALMESTTTEEWDALQKAETRAMKTMASIMQRI